MGLIAHLKVGAQKWMVFGPAGWFQKAASFELVPADIQTRLSLQRPVKQRRRNERCHTSHIPTCDHIRRFTCRAALHAMQHVFAFFTYVHHHPQYMCLIWALQSVSCIGYLSKTYLQ